MNFEFNIFYGTKSETKHRKTIRIISVNGKVDEKDIMGWKQ